MNNTLYDHLRGVLDRHTHPHIPEPEVAMIFRKKNGKPGEVDMTELERKLRRAKKEVCTNFSPVFLNVFYLEYYTI